MRSDERIELRLAVYDELNRAAVRAGLSNEAASAQAMESVLGMGDAALERAGRSALQARRAAYNRRKLAEA